MCPASRESTTGETVVAQLWLGKSTYRGHLHFLEDLDAPVNLLILSGDHRPVCKSEEGRQSSY